MWSALVFAASFLIQDYVQTNLTVPKVSLVGIFFLFNLFVIIKMLNFNISLNLLGAPESGGG